MSVTDDAFKNFAKDVENEELERSNKKSTGGFVYERIKWTGIPEKGYKIIRGLGEAPNSNSSPYTSRTIRHSRIKADNGKDIFVNLPVGMDADEHIMWKIINKVLEVEWIDNKKYYINEKRHPDIFNMVNRNSYPEGSRQAKYDKGWSGRDMFIMNCIDRDPTQYKWSKENKHTMLLSKSVSVGTNAKGDTIEYAETGVPSYGFANTLALNVFKHYGDWNNYDIAIEKTAIMQNPYRIINAFKYKEEIPENLQGLIVEGPLTEEELSWERYNLETLFKVTSYTKILNRLEKSIAKIDLSLGTSYLEQLKSLAKEEKLAREESAEEEEQEESPVIIEEETSPVVTKSTRTPSTGNVTLEPKGYKFLTEDEKSQVVSMKQISGDHWDMSYKDSSKLSSCNVCKTISPEFFVTCPGCGSTF